MELLNLKSTQKSENSQVILCLGSTRWPCERDTAITHDGHALSFLMIAPAIESQLKDRAWLSLRLMFTANAQEKLGAVRPAGVT